MQVTKNEALKWFEFFESIAGEEELMADQRELCYAVLSDIEQKVQAENAEIEKQIKDLKTLADRTNYVGPAEKFPKGCKSCLFGTGLSAIRKTNKCNANCKFCYDYGHLDDIPPIGEGFWEIGGTKFREEDIDLLFSASKVPTGVAYVYLEPFCEIEKYYGIIKKFADKGVYQHMYTNGIAATEEQLKALGEAGLDELRFNLGASNASDKVIEKIALAKKYIKQVGIETPMTPELYKAFLAKKDKILATGLDFINFAELHLNENNIDNYAKEPLYCYRLGYISPIFSHRLTLEMMKIASEESWDVCVHDCDNRTKFARDLNLGAKEQGWFGASSYGMEFDEVPFGYFLPAIKKYL